MSDPEHQERLLKATSSSPTVGIGWLATMSRPVRKLLEWFLVLSIIGFLVCQLFIVRKNVIESALAAHPPIEFTGEWTPDKEVYKPGDVIRLYYVRKTMLPPGESEPVMALSLDAFENRTNGEIFAGAIIGRVIDKEGTVQRVAVRTIPPEASDGEYIFEGWMQAQTYRRSVPVWYQSKPFQIKR